MFFFERTPDCSVRNSGQGPQRIHMTKELHHITNHDLDRYSFDAITGLELALIEEHLLWCPDCLNRAEENFRDILEKGRAHLGHISTDDLERYQRGQLNDTPTRAGIEQHVTECQECADRMLAIERFVHLVRTGVIERGFE